MADDLSNMNLNMPPAFAEWNALYDQENCSCRKRRFDPNVQSNPFPVSHPSKRYSQTIDHSHTEEVDLIDFCNELVSLSTPRSKSNSLLLEPEQGLEEFTVSDDPFESPSHILDSDIISMTPQISEKLSEKTERTEYKKAIGVLLKWFLDNSGCPYPSREQKQQLMNQTGLSRSQIRNYFTNIRKRHWKPVKEGQLPRSMIDFMVQRSIVDKKEILSNKTK